MESAKCAAELGKIIKYCKNLGEIKKALQFSLIFKWPLLEPKVVHSARVGAYLWKFFGLWNDMIELVLIHS